MYIDVLLLDDNMISFDEFVDIDYKINSSDNNELLLGNASAASLNFSIWNGDKSYNAFKFKNSKIFLYRDIERTNKLGEFNIDKVTKDKNTLKLECIDYMASKCDEIFKGIQTPFTIWQLVTQIGLQLDIPIRNTQEDFKHLTQTYSDTNDILGKKCREIIKWIGEISCKYAIFDEDGKLFFNWYDLDTIKKEIPYSVLKDFARDEDLTYVSGLSCVLDNEEYLIGDKNSFDLIISTDNPFLKPLDGANRKKILEDVYSKVHGMQFLSCDIGLSTDNEIKVGDTLKVYDEDGNYYKIIASYINISKVFSMKITSSGANVNRSSGSSSSSSGGASESEKIHYAKDENFKPISLFTKEEVYLNSIKIDGVTEKTSAYLNYSLNFEFNSNNDNTINFKIYINDIVKTIPYKPTYGINTFTWGEKLNLQVSIDGSAISNEIKVTMDLTHNSSSSSIEIDMEKSIMTIIATGAKSAGGNLVTNIEIKEEIQRVSLRNEMDLLTIKRLSDRVEEILIEEYSQYDFNDSVDAFNFKKNQINVLDNINELLG